MALRFYNTMTRNLEPFQPLDEGRVSMYTCGPTVYNVAHIGNFRAYIFEDLLRRTLRTAGYAVEQVMNLTDVDDKTIRGARERGVSLDAYTRPYKDAFFEDLKALRIEPAEHYPEATGCIAEMIDLIRRLEDKGFAYRSDDGSVYFSISKFPEYGRLARIDLAGLQAGARVSQDEYEKEHVGDFALWKAWSEEDGAVGWDSPWGRGRPGWHIECSAMSMKYLGESFDIHTGGIDNMFPHHVDEIAQSEGATGKPLAHTWLHCAHLIVDGTKMSKSAGNFFTLRDLLDRGYSGRQVRYELMTAHYRQTLNFRFEGLDAARAALSRIDDFVRRVDRAAVGAGAPAVPPWAAEAERRFRDAMEDDLNVPGALSALFDLIHETHRRLDANGLDAAGAAGVRAVAARMDEVLAVLEPENESIGEEVQNLLAARAAARAEKQYGESDRLRDELKARGWLVQDTPDGQQLSRV
jgi:cysteinyl-tRNA synthetase